MRKRLHTVATGWLLAAAVLSAGTAWGQCKFPPNPCSPTTCCFDRLHTVIDATTSCNPAQNNGLIFLTGNSDNYKLSGISLAGVTVCIGNNDLDIDASVTVDNKTVFLSQGQFGLTISQNGKPIYDFTDNGQGGPATDGSLAQLNAFMAGNCTGGCTILQVVFGVLPVTLESWSVQTRRSGVILEWVTTNEKDNDYFRIERSRDGRVFREIGRVPGQGTAEIRTTYRYVDEAPDNGRNYYRLSQFDFDGTSEVFGVRSADWGAAPMTVQPNPVRSGAELWVELPTPAQGPATLHGLDGRLWGRYVLAGGGRNRIQLPASLPAGVYLLRIGERSHRITVY